LTPYSFPPRRSSDLAFVDSSVISDQTHRAWFDAYAERDDDYVFVIEERALGRPVGQVSLYAIDWKARTATFGRLLIGDDDALGRDRKSTRLNSSHQI